MSIDEVPSETPPRHAYDFSNLQGLQVVGAHLDATEDHASEAWREALRLELEARAARFHHAVDASIVLSDDGVIRWLGDPVARLATGPDLLTPRALVLADANLPESGRETVIARLELWLAATTRRLLGPLLALRSLQDESEPVRRLATKIADSLGVLEREPLRSRIKALDQNARAAFETSRGQVRGPLRLHPSIAQACVKGLGAPTLERQDGGCQRRGIRESAASARVDRANVVARQSVDHQGGISRGGVPPVRRACSPSRYCRAPFGYDPSGARNLLRFRRLPGVGVRICRKWPDDVVDGLLGGCICIDPSVAWI